MTDSIWNDLCKQPVSTASSEKYTKLVNDATTRLVEPIDSIMATLNDRAMGLSKLGNFNAALRDAQVMQQISSSSALGYLREASIYNEQGNRRQAVDICQKGLNRVGTNDPHYATLQRAKEDAEHDLSNRVDFIKELPLDIVTAMLVPKMIDDGYLDAFEPSPSLYVSNVWRDRIIQSLGGLRFRIGKEDEDLSAVVEFARHIKALKVEQYTQGTWLGDLMGDNDFFSLCELHIKDFWSIHIGNFLSSLKSFSSTLTRLVLEMEDDPMLGVSEVVLACPSLTLLRIVEAHDADLSLLPATTWPTLTTLSLTDTQTAITLDEILEIWKRFPSLKKATLAPCTDIQSALVVSEYCPTMNTLRLCMDCVGIKLTYSDEGICDTGGIANLIIETDEMAEELCKNTTSIIKHYHDTLTHLEWDMDISEDTDNIDTIQFPRLKKFGLFCPGFQILHNAPILEELILTSDIAKLFPEVLNAIPPLLKALELKLTGSLDYELRSSIVVYLNRIALQYQLKKLAVHVNNCDNEAIILDAICRHRYLESLKISIKNEWDTYRMERFIAALVRSCPLLSSLEFKCKNAPSPSSINMLKRLAHLNQFAFAIHDTGGTNSFWDALRTFPQLTCITIYPSSVIHDARMNYVKQQRPDMRIIIDRNAIRF